MVSTFSHTVTNNGPAAFVALLLYALFGNHGKWITDVFESEGRVSHVSYDACVFYRRAHSIRSGHLQHATRMAKYNN